MHTEGTRAGSVRTAWEGAAIWGDRISVQTTWVRGTNDPVSCSRANGTDTNLGTRSKNYNFPKGGRASSAMKSELGFVFDHKLGINQQTA